ncbi:hypothetical protein ACFOW6_13950 [Fodinicurvata halophila]|uniref:Uncharacterized protein n=1 Tax=Fodinicurvata halophila TaxID=1419723 RepID=A0ABV8UNG0_9PROT
MKLSVQFLLPIRAGVDAVIGMVVEEQTTEATRPQRSVKPVGPVVVLTASLSLLLWLMKSVVMTRHLYPNRDDCLHTMARSARSSLLRAVSHRP